VRARGAGVVCREKLYAREVIEVNFWTIFIVLLLLMVWGLFAFGSP